MNPFMLTATLPPTKEQVDAAIDEAMASKKMTLKRAPVMAQQPIRTLQRAVETQAVGPAGFSNCPGGVTIVPTITGWACPGVCTNGGPAAVETNEEGAWTGRLVCPPRTTNVDLSLPPTPTETAAEAGAQDAIDENTFEPPQPPLLPTPGDEGRGYLWLGAGVLIAVIGGYLGYRFIIKGGR